MSKKSETMLYFSIQSTLLAVSAALLALFITRGGWLSLAFLAPL